MTILVTGGAGVIGSHLARRLLDAGHRVVVLDDLSSGHGELVPAGAELVIGSVANDDDLSKAFDFGPTRVAHLAALFANQNSVDHPIADLFVNGAGTLRVLERSAAAGIERVLVCSSSCIYGAASRSEETLMTRATDTPYAITKALGEDYARYFSESQQLDTVIVRPFNAYGPGERPGPYRNVIPNFFAAAMRGEPLPITGTGEETRDFTYVTDIASGMMSALFAPTTPGTAFNLASGRSTSIATLARMINELCDNRAGTRSVEARSWDRVPHRSASIDRARDVLGYEPAVALEDGLRLTHEWLLSQR